MLKCPEFCSLAHSCSAACKQLCDDRQTLDRPAHVAKTAGALVGAGFYCFAAISENCSDLVNISRAPLANAVALTIYADNFCDQHPACLGTI